MKLLLLYAAITCLPSCYASSGDRSHIYQDCVSRCHTQSCAAGPADLPIALRLTRWTCTDDCKYQCMHLITDAAIDTGERIHQYHGKWPFWRFAGMQEPASVAFSLLNLLFHVRGAQRVRQRIPIEHPMRWYYLAFSAVSVNAWIWSSVFHTRDLPTTEKLDYFSAALAIIYALFYTIVRLFHLYPRRTPQHFRRRAHHIWATVCCVAYISHVTYLTVLPRFDYTYNMAFNLGIGMTHNVLWLLYSLPASLSLVRRFPGKPKSYRPTFASKAAVFVLLTTAATVLELFDFPPWYRTIDAHSLWHLATAPIAAFWYQFLIEDSLDDSWRTAKSE
ncbi:hypothetical protein PHLGIDRAFT_415639 [Phlebiopsis gigantea 11061_1 CR5-6]|uniref:Post-GPI attachment to proteins factor 3 n=1 Tax=Phlebiopsis gigantea (strain 11061_1 CR5-6) TaxID=745531 RepID=A0A0C3PLS9_PHLG1|nr:hypothetical protein PHLGIDRAFT_415639 [Phlebiopsis gigantea 11061_1 CR5-6]